MDQLPFSEVEDNDDVLSYRRPQPPHYRRRDRRVVNGINVESQSVPSPGRYYHRARRARSRSVSSSYSSPVQEQPRHRKSEKKKELKRKKRHTSLSPPPPPRRRNSSGLPWYIRPFLPSLGSCTLIIVSVAIILVSILCFVIRRDVISMLQIGSHYVETIAIRPLQAIQNGTLNVFTSMWCGTLEWWCMATPKANKTFHARKFHDLPTTPCPEERFAELPKLDVSLGNSFFDCLEDLGRVRGYKTELAHLFTLFAHVKQVEWLLEDPDDLYDDLYSLAQYAYTFTESRRTKALYQLGAQDQTLLEHMNFALQTTTKRLSSSANYMTRTVTKLSSEKELMKKISSRIHHELAQLKKSNTKTRSDKLFRFKNLLAPGLGDVIKERLDTADFLNEVLVVVETGVSVFLDNSISLQQCEINTKHLNDGLERTFSLINTELKISRKIRHISTEIQPLKTLLDEYDETTSSKRRREKK